jgi:hypothetical protein
MFMTYGEAYRKGMQILKDAGIEARPMMPGFCFAMPQSAAGHLSMHMETSSWRTG